MALKLLTLYVYIEQQWFFHKLTLAVIFCDLNYGHISKDVKAYLINNDLVKAGEIYSHEKDDLKDQFDSIFQFFKPDFYFIEKCYSNMSHHYKSAAKH